MKVAMYYNNKDIRIKEMELPQIKKGELLVKVKASGICGSDLMEWYRAKSAPRVLGHEVAGEIVEVGESVEKFKTGQRVIVTHHVPCYDCHYCNTGRHTSCKTLHSTNFFPGGFSEFIRVPQINVKFGTFLLPKNVSFEEGSFVEPLGCVVRAQKIAGLKAGCTVLVIGSGVSGLLHIQLAKQNKAKKVIATDMNEFRLLAAQKFGADTVINAKENVQERILKENENKLADFAIVCAGSVHAFEQAIQSVGAGGTILLFAPTEPQKNFQFNVCEFWLKGKSLISSYAAAKEDLKESLELIGSRQIKVKELITHRLSLDKIQSGFNLAAKASESLKIMILPT